jgi:hypothetical protein
MYKDKYMASFFFKINRFQDLKKCNGKIIKNPQNS